MIKWYQALSTLQKIFLFGVAVAASFVVVGIPILLFLVYLEIGNRTLYFDGAEGSGTFHDYKVELNEGVKSIYESADYIKHCLISIWKLDADLAHHLATFEVLKLVHGDPMPPNSTPPGLSGPPFIQSEWYKSLQQDLWGFPNGFFCFRHNGLKINSSKASYCLEELKKRQNISKLDNWYQEDVSGLQKAFLFVTAIAASFVIVGIPFLVLLVYLELGRLSLDITSVRLIIE